MRKARKKLASERRLSRPVRPGDNVERRMSMATGHPNISAGFRVEMALGRLLFWVLVKLMGIKFL